MKFSTLKMAVLACTHLLLQGAFAQDSWTSVAPLPDSRWLLAAATAGDGKIYAIAGNVGGPDFYGTTETVLAYDPNADTWQQVASLSAPRQNLAAAADLNGRIYAIGGYLHGFPFFRSTVECFDPQVGYWMRRAEMPTARQGLAAATDASGLIYALGGSFTFSAPTSLVEVYDPVADAWFAGTAMLSPREGFAATTGRDGRIYVLGGFDGNAYLQSAEVYDPAANIWTAIAPMQSVRYGLAAATGSDGRIYAIGGYAGSDLSSVEAYDPATDSWTYVASMSVPREGHAVTAAPDGRIFAIAGPGNTVEAYTLALISPDKHELSRSRGNRLSTPTVTDYRSPSPNRDQVIRILTSKIETFTEIPVNQIQEVGRVSEKIPGPITACYAAAALQRFGSICPNGSCGRWPDRYLYLG